MYGISVTFTAATCHTYRRVDIHMCGLAAYHTYKRYRTYIWWDTALFLQVTKRHSKNILQVPNHTTKCKTMVLIIKDLLKRSSFDIFWGDVFIMIMIMNLFSHHDDYNENKNNMPKILQNIDLKGIFSQSEKWKRARTCKKVHSDKSFHTNSSMSCHQNSGTPTFLWSW